MSEGMPAGWVETASKPESITWTLAVDDSMMTVTWARIFRGRLLVSLSGSWPDGLLDTPLLTSEGLDYHPRKALRAYAEFVNDIMSRER